MKKFLIYHGQALEKLKRLPDNSIDCCVTSPPYYNLRDYKTEDQIGLEKTPEEYVEVLVEIFEEVRRVLKDTGTFWLVIGDSYAASGRGGDKSGKRKAVPDTVGEANQRRLPPTGYKKKDLIGIPWMMAFALRNKGWYLRRDIIWNKTVCLPESVKDRPSCCHEYIFFFTKTQKYFYDCNAILEPYSPETLKQIDSIYRGKGKKEEGTKAQNPSDTKRRIIEGLKKRGGRNKRTVWHVNRAISKKVHTAVFPEALITPCILAGCPVKGIVLDPFLGSGTTAVVALKNGRRAVGIELRKKYVEIARESIQEAGF